MVAVPILLPALESRPGGISWFPLQDHESGISWAPLVHWLRAQCPEDSSSLLHLHPDHCILFSLHDLVLLKHTMGYLNQLLLQARVTHRGSMAEIHCPMSPVT